MAPKQIQTPGKNAKQTEIKKPEDPPALQLDVDDALIDDQHPKDTIRGGPADKKSPGPA
jgi:hypothetical protein